MSILKKVKSLFKKETVKEVGGNPFVIFAALISPETDRVMVYGFDRSEENSQRPFKIIIVDKSSYSKKTIELANEPNIIHSWSLSMEESTLALKELIDTGVSAEVGEKYMRLMAEFVKISLLKLEEVKSSINKCVCGHHDNHSHNH